MKTPIFWYKQYTFISSALIPFSLIWLLFSYLKNIIVKQKKFNVPVVCVGNAIAGGSGKTPLAIEICRHYRKRGVNIHVIYKAYKVQLDRDVIRINSRDTASNLVDESLMLSEHAPTWLCKNRKKGIEKAIKNGAELILLDDGLQDISIKKDVNILVSNQVQGNGNFKLIPAGPLREPLHLAMGKSSCIFFYGNKKKFKQQFLNYKKSTFFGEITTNKNNIRKLKKIKIIAFAGIAHPDNFFNFLENNKINVIKKIYFADHYNYNREELEKIIEMSLKKEATPLTTFKDYVKIPKDLKKSFAILDIHIKFNNVQFFRFLNNKIKSSA